MIWSIVSKKEMDGFGTSPVFRFYREALGKENIKLAIVDEQDTLDFVQKDDIVLLRTANENIINNIKKRGVVSTAENYETYQLISDKTILANLLAKKGIKVPKQYDITEVVNGKTYFVKPKFGSDSMGISLQSICKSKKEVEKQISYIHNELKDEAIIEDFIDGIDCTVACWQPSDLCWSPAGKLHKPASTIHTCAIEVECEETLGIQTRDCKVGFKECCSVLHDLKVKNIAKEVFKILNIKHHARIDFRKDKNGEYYLIDVNLLPGLGPIDHFAKCLLLARNMSYKDAIVAIINTSSK